MKQALDDFTVQLTEGAFRSHPLYRTPDQLREYGQQKVAPPPIIPVVTLLNSRFIFRKRTAFIVAAGGTGKTIWNRRLTWHLSRGEKFGGFAPNREGSRPGQAKLRIVNFCGEDDPDSLKESIWFMSGGEPAGDWFNFPMAGNRLTLMENDGKGNLSHSEEFHVVRQILLDIVAESGPLDIVTFDTLARFFGLPGASFDSEVAQTWMTQVAERVANEFDCAVVVYAHTQKGLKELNADMLRGASGWRDAARLVCGMIPLSENDALLADIEDEDNRKTYIKLGIVKTNNTKSSFPPQYFRIFSTKGDTGDIEPAQLVQDRIERMKIHFLFLIKDKDLSVAELFRGASDEAKAVNKGMIDTFPSYTQTKDPGRLVSSLVEDGLVSEIDRAPANGGRAKLVIRLSDLAKKSGGGDTQTMKNNTECRSAIGLQLKMHIGNLHSESRVLLNSYCKNINCRCKRMQNGTLQLWNMFKFKRLMSNAQLQLPFPYGEEKHMQLLFSLGPAGTQGDGGLTQL